jgi:hypothetical protein
MKPYKLQRRQKEHAEKHPTKFVRKQKLIKATRLLAIRKFKGEFQNYWYSQGTSDKEIFGWQLNQQIDLQLTYADVEVFYPIYVKCIELMDKKKAKSDFIQKEYIPLEEDLFEL